MDRDRSVFRRALEISLLLHLVAVFLLAPRLVDVWPTSSRMAKAMAARVQPQQQKPLEFEFVDMPSREETPEHPEEAPMSDLDRRAHGGDQEQPPDDRPATTGNTPQLVQAEGAERLGSGSPPTRQAPRPVPPSREIPPQQQREQAAEETRRRGAGEEQRPDEQEAAPQQPSIRLPPAGARQLSPDIGGLRENPDRDGGSVDTGALSFDTQWYDWGPYAKAMLRKIRRNWVIPEIARLGVAGVVKVRYFIERDGTVTGLRIVSESGKPPMDFAARDAIAYSSPFKPLPEDLTGVEREGVTITFYYNTHPPEWDRE